MKIIEIEGEALEALKHEVILATGNNDYRIRIAVEGGQLKVKRNEHMWSPPLGRVNVVERS